MSGLMVVDEYRDGGWYRRVTRCTECKKELFTSDDWRECKRRHFLEFMWRTDPDLMRRLERNAQVRNESSALVDNCRGSVTTPPKVSKP